MAFLIEQYCYQYRQFLNDTSIIMLIISWSIKWQLTQPNMVGNWMLITDSLMIHRNKGQVNSSSINLLNKIIQMSCLSDQPFGIPLFLQSSTRMWNHFHQKANFSWWWLAAVRGNLYTPLQRHWSGEYKCEKQLCVTFALILLMA